MAKHLITWKEQSTETGGGLIRQKEWIEAATQKDALIFVETMKHWETYPKVIKQHEAGELQPSLFEETL